MDQDLNNRETELERYPETLKEVTARMRKKRRDLQIVEPKRSKVRKNSEDSLLDRIFPD